MTLDDLIPVDISYAPLHQRAFKLPTDIADTIKGSESLPFIFIHKGKTYDVGFLCNRIDKDTFYPTHRIYTSIGIQICKWEPDFITDESYEKLLTLKLLASKCEWLSLLPRYNLGLLVSPELGLSSDPSPLNVAHSLDSSFHSGEQGSLIGFCDWLADLLISDIGERRLYLQSSIRYCADLVIDKVCAYQPSQASKLPASVRDIIAPELARYTDKETPLQERQAIKDYLNVVSSIPWGVIAPCHASDGLTSSLDKTHYGMATTKKALIRIAEIYMKANCFPKALCLVGPPGVGKTTLLRSLAKAIGLPTAIIPLAGAKDQHVLLGFTKSYNKAQPGKIIKALIQARAMNPILILDEIDKCEAPVHNTLLSLLDSENKDIFTDDYLGFPIDLKHSLIFTTANDLNMIPAPLLDRLLIIEVPGYSKAEEEQIITQYLIPKIRLLLHEPDREIVIPTYSKSIRDIENDIYLSLIDAHNKPKQKRDLGF